MHDGTMGRKKRQDTPEAEREPASPVALLARPTVNQTSLGSTSKGMDKKRYFCRLQECYRHCRR